MDTSIDSLLYCLVGCMVILKSDSAMDWTHIAKIRHQLGLSMLTVPSMPVIVRKVSCIIDWACP